MLLLNITISVYPSLRHRSLVQRLRAVPVVTVVLMSSLFRLAVLHFALVRVLRRVEDIHGPLATNGTLDDDREVSPDGLRHRDEDAGVVKVLLVLWPTDALLVAFLRARTLLERQAGKEKKKAGQQDEPDAAGVQRGVGAAATRQGAIACRCDCDDVDSLNHVSGTFHLSAYNE